MPDLLIEVNGQPMQVAPGTTVACALLSAGAPCRVSLTGMPRYPLCGMGICYECRAEVDGVPHLRTCQLLCRAGMVVRTQC